jgi:D-hexose-6-phosphate mutarotase
MNSQLIEKLNEEFGIADQLCFQNGNGDIPYILIENQYAKAQICLQGAHVTEFQPHTKPPILWLSQKSEYKTNHPIRGGVPLCWPWFGPNAENDQLPAHGFARRQRWQVARTAAPIDGTTRIELTLADTPETHGLWDFKFNLALRVTVGPSLTLALTTCNSDTRAFQITQALHTYLSVGDSSQITIRGLEKTDYLDGLTGEVRRQTTPITITEETNRIYLQTTATCVVEDPVLKRKIAVSKSGSHSTVIWNPWIAKSGQMPDFGADEYHEMVCVETTNAGDDFIRLAPGDRHTIRTEIQEIN